MYLLVSKLNDRIFFSLLEILFNQRYCPLETYKRCRLYIIADTVVHVSGTVLPALGVICASYSGCDRTLVTILFTLGMGSVGFFYAALPVNSLDLSPNYAGSIMAVVNGTGSLSGMIAPYVLGLLTPNVSVTNCVSTP